MRTSYQVRLTTLLSHIDMRTNYLTAGAEHPTRSLIESATEKGPNVT